MEIIDDGEIRKNNKFLKEDLERYYVEERKSIKEISRIYGCHIDTVKSRLKKYNIPIRPHGAFLVCDDGESLNSKRIKGEITQSEYLVKCAKNKGFRDDNSRERRQIYDIPKEDLERYYIDEKKTLTEISKFYGCHIDTITKKLKKYKIPIRPRGSFLVDDDGETLNSKLVKGEISSSEYYNKRAKRKGFDNKADYQNELTKKRGFEDVNEYNRQIYYKNSGGLPMNENKDCTLYLGVYIAERILPLLFENVKKMPDCNPGFDFICNNNYKIDVKSACLSSDTWTLVINKNKITDYFFMVVFDNRDDLNVMHIWLVKGDATIEKTTYNSEEYIINEKNSVTISKGSKSLERWKCYEKIDMLEKAQKICDEFMNNNSCEI